MPLGVAGSVGPWDPMVLGIPGCPWSRVNLAGWARNEVTVVLFLPQLIKNIPNVENAPRSRHKKIWCVQWLVAGTQMDHLRHISLGPNS